MKLERLPEYVLITVVVTIGLLFAFYAGKLTASDQVDRVIIILGMAILVGIIIKVRQRIWMAIPISFPLLSTLVFLPLPFSTRDLCVLIALGSYLVFKALKMIRGKPTYDFTDILLLFNLLYLASAFVRNPTGTEAMGSARVGGRPYVDVIVACLAYWVMCRSELPVKYVRRLLYLVVLATVCEAGIVAVINFIPFIGSRLVPYFNDAYLSLDISTTGGVAEAAAMDETGRVGFLAPVANNALLCLISIFPPMTLISPIYFGRFVAFVLAMLALLFSGFRSLLIQIGGYFCLSSYFKGSLVRIVPLYLGIGSLLLIAGFVNGTIFSLPMAVQRSLCFLPGHWDEEAVLNAQASSQWRFEMWQQVLGSDKYIHDRIFGDGFGLDKRTLDENVQRDLMTKEIGQGSQAMQENFMRTGDFHSGPLSMLRTVGYVGGALYYWFLFVAMRRAWRMIVKCRGTPYFPVALFYGLPLVLNPFYFSLVTGAFRDNLRDTIFWLGMLKVIELSLERSALLPKKEDNTSSRPVGLRSWRPELEPALKLVPAPSPRGRVVR